VDSKIIRILIGRIMEKCRRKFKRPLREIRWINLDEKELKLETNLEWRGLLWR
jgi:hypothetical protein